MPSEAPLRRQCRVLLIIESKQMVLFAVDMEIGIQRPWGFQVSDCWPHKEQGANNPGIKKKELEMTEFETTGDAANEISPYVRNDNVERKHSAIEYLTPAQFEQLNQRSK